MWQETLWAPCARTPSAKQITCWGRLRANRFVICEALVAIQHRVPGLNPANRRVIRGAREACNIEMLRHGTRGEAAAGPRVIPHHALSMIRAYVAVGGWCLPRTSRSCPCMYVYT